MQNKGKVGEDLITEYLTMKSAAEGIPVSGTFELTPQCNMNCRMCYLRKSQEEIIASGFHERSAKEWISLAKECKDAGMLYLLFTGGEPFFRKDFRYIYEEIHKMGFIISLNTNATMITEDTIEWLKKYPPNRVNITVYGSSNETYERLCHNRFGFDQMKQGLELMLDAGFMVRLNSTLNPENKNDLEEIFAFADAYGLEVHFGTYIFPAIRKDEKNQGNNDRMTPYEAAMCECIATDITITEDEFLERARNIREGCEGEGDILNTEECKRDFGEPLACRAGRSTFWINWKGQMTACGMMNDPYVEPFDMGFEKAWKFIRESTERMRMPTECATCNKRFFCHVCGAVCNAETGRVDGLPSYVCEMTEQIRVITAQKERKVLEEKYNEENS